MPFLVRKLIYSRNKSTSIYKKSYKKSHKMIIIMSTKELDLGTQRIKAQGNNYYFRVPKKLVDTGALSVKTDYHIIVKDSQVTIEKEVPA